MTLVVYGARCVWWNTIDKAGTSSKEAHALPCCPHYGGVLFQQEESDWWAGVSRYESDHPGYRKFVDWWRGRCFPTFAAAKQAYKAAGGGLDLDVLKWIDD
jgi:hypothetical protein